MRWSNEPRIGGRSTRTCSWPKPWHRFTRSSGNDIDYSKDIFVDHDVDLSHPLIPAIAGIMSETRMSQPNRLERSMSTFHLKTNVQFHLHLSKHHSSSIHHSLPHTLGYNYRPRLSNLNLYTYTYILLAKHCREQAWYIIKRGQAEEPLPWYSDELVELGDYDILVNGKSNHPARSLIV